MIKYSKNKPLSFFSNHICVRLSFLCATTEIWLKMGYSSTHYRFYKTCICDKYCMHVVYANLNSESKMIDEEIKQFKKSN